MLKELLDEKKLTLYALSRRSGLPYSTVSDIVSGKTAWENVSAGTLCRIADCLDMTMDQLYHYGSDKRKLYLYNEDRHIYLQIGDIRLSYLGPKNLVGFKRVNRILKDCLYIDTYFLDEEDKIYAEEDYYDLGDLFEENGCGKALAQPYDVILGRPEESTREYLIDNALMVSDNMAILISGKDLPDISLEITNLKRNSDHMLLRLNDYAVLSTNMSSGMQKRAIDAVNRNRELIEEEIREVLQYA